MLSFPQADGGAGGNAFGKFGIAPCQKDDFFSGNLAIFQTGQVLCAGEQRHIQLVLQQALFQAGGGFFVGFKLHVGISRIKVVEHLRKKLIRAMALQTDTYRSACMAAQQMERLLKLRFGLHDSACSLHIQFACRCERNGRVPAHENAFSELGFDLAHRLGEGGLRDGERFCCGGKAAVSQDGENDLGVTGIHEDVSFRMALTYIVGENSFFVYRKIRELGIE